MLRRVLDASGRRQQLHVGAVRAQLIANHGCAGLVFIAGRIDGGDPNQACRKIDDLVRGAIDLRDDAIGV